MPRRRAALLAAAWSLAALVSPALVSPARASQAGELVMFEAPNCPVCLRWHRELAAIYPRTPEAAAAPLRRVPLGQDSGIALAEPVRYSPTFVYAVGGAEVGRITGYLNDDMFWGLLGRLLARRPGWKAP